MRRQHIKIGILDIQFRKWDLTALKEVEVKPVRGVDTETLNGYCRLIADDGGNYTLTDTLEPILKFLTQRRFRSAHSFFYNQRFDFQAIIKYLPEDKLEELYTTGKTTTGRYRIKYIPKKVFTIIKNRHIHKFYDVAQFFETRLQTAAETYLSDSKDDGDLDVKRIGSEAEYWDAHKERIIEYCIKDAQLTQRLGELLNETVVNRLGIKPRSYISKAGLSKDNFRTQCQVPRIGNIPIWATSVALNAYAGGRFEVTRKGNTGKTYGIDICSAYPDEIARLPELSTGEWRRVKDVHEDALLGFYMVKASIPESALGPLPYRNKKGFICYPVGSFLTYISKIEYETFRDDVEFNIIRGVEYYDPKPSYPFRDEIRRLYAMKQETPKEDFKYSLIKIILNALYGSFYEKIPSGKQYYAGKLFMPVYATTITAGTRAKMWQVLRRYQNDVVASATDGILLKKEPDLPTGKGLGEWDDEGAAEVIILRSGIYLKGDILKQRGIKRRTKIRTKSGEYDNLFEYFKAVPNLTEYPMLCNRPLNLGECLRHRKKYSPENINQFTDVNDTIYINRDLKRVWFDKFEGGGELFTKEIGSLPVHLGYEGEA